ncbi:MAG: transcriptional repressor [Gemmatimonadaceae bacterium]|nr:transcriptional repressor [Gemmatimonadaceae bacterium]
MERRTRQRQAIEAALAAAERPLTPVEVLDAARHHVPQLGLATVYRALRALIQDGAAHLVEIPGTPPRYETAHLGHHHHFHCRQCHRLYEVEGCPGNLARYAPPGFRLDGHDVVLYGRCAQCGAA